MKVIPNAFQLRDNDYPDMTALCNVSLLRYTPHHFTILMKHRALKCYTNPPFNKPNTVAMAETVADPLLQCLTTAVITTATITTAYHTPIADDDRR